MSFEISEFFDQFAQVFSTMNLGFAIGFTLLFFGAWFLPSIVALFCNRKHLGKTLLANVPAGLSWIAWLALLAWAVTGKRRSKKEAERPPEPSA